MRGVKKSAREKFADRGDGSGKYGQLRDGESIKLFFRKVAQRVDTTSSYASPLLVDGIDFCVETDVQLPVAIPA